ncbi:hypothetical protein ATO13_05715 [Stappia sp. 22II-S9-Z10]|nr:hypothetical protein ATO13_05715 [Stappia sp. 22II-S9-Z10]
MFERLTLHIGHNKTGTTSLQETLRLSAPHLTAHGLFYWDGAGNHKAIARHFGGEDGAEGFAAFMAAARRSTARHALVSAETLVRLDDEAAARLVAAMGEIAAAVDVLLYVRHPVGFASSAAQQAVRAGVSLRRLTANPPLVPFAELIPRWRRAVVARPGTAGGALDNVIVRPFERAAFAGGDVVTDALTVLGFADAVAGLTRVEANTGLSALAVHLIDAALTDRERRAGLSQATMGAYGGIGGPAYVLPAEALERVRTLSAPHLAFLAQQCGIHLTEPAAIPTPPPALSSEELTSLGRVLLSAVQDQHRAATARPTPGLVARARRLAKSLRARG